MILTKIGPQGLILPHPRAICMYITIIFRALVNFLSTGVFKLRFSPHLRKSILRDLMREILSIKILLKGYFVQR